MLKQIKAETSTTQVLANINFNTTFSDILVVVESLQNGVTPAAAQAYNGRIRVTKRGMPVVDCQPQFLRFHNNFFGGSNVVTLGTNDNDPQKYYFKIPRSLFGERNVDHVTPNDLYTIEYTFGSSFASTSDNGDIRIFIKECKGVSYYDLTIMQQNHNLAASQEFPLTISQDNICQILIAAADANGLPTLASAEAIDDGRYRLDIAGNAYSALVEDARTDTTLNYKVEVAADNADASIIYDSSLVGVTQGNGMADTAQLSVLNGAAADVLAVLVVGKRFAQTNYVDSSQQNNSYKATELNTKRVTGKSTAVARYQDLGVV